MRNNSKKIYKIKKLIWKVSIENYNRYSIELNS